MLVMGSLSNWLEAIRLISSFTVIIWCIALLNHMTGYAFNHLGIFPRDPEGLVGILFWVLLHGDFMHALLNTTPLLFLGFFVALRGASLYFRITFLVWVVAGLLVWLFGRNAVHIGASGLIFGYFGFLLAVALNERNIFDLGVASLTLFYYGGMFFGLLPAHGLISWESHVAGLAAGILAARWFGKEWVKRESELSLRPRQVEP